MAMKLRGWVRATDPADCGGTVAEGSSCEFSGGIGYAFQGARMACSKGCVIAEGYSRSLLSNGAAQVLDGQLTSGGCRLASTLNGVDGVAGGD
ncbi:MAG: PAAR domain-containing protein [Telluria sp.]